MGPLPEIRCIDVVVTRPLRTPWENAIHAYAHTGTGTADEEINIAKSCFYEGRGSMLWQLNFYRA